jgi:putative membrane protein
MIFTNPSLYLLNLVKRTLFMGLFLFLIYELFIKYFHISQQTIPSTLHSLIGIVLGLLLVFRTNTAYDRWWEARKIFSSIHSIFLYIRTRCLNNEGICKSLNSINDLIFRYVSDDNREASILLKECFIKEYLNLSKLIAEADCTPSVHGILEKKLGDLLDFFTSLERIKDTPIPYSYSFHIKISIFSYLVTLPFGLFYGLGVWSIPLIMILFFIIAGIDIISSEIENPFRGDPNDLPIDEFKNENKKYIDGREQKKTD